MTKDYQGILIHISDRKINQYYYSYFFIGASKYNFYGLTKIEAIYKPKRAIDDIISIQMCGGTN